MSANVREEIVKLIIDDDQVTGTHNELKTAQKQIIKNMKGMKEGSREYNKETLKLTRVNKQLDQSNKKIKSVGKEWKAQSTIFKNTMQSQLDSFRVMGISVGGVTRNIGMMNSSIGASSKALKLFKIALVSTGLGALVVLLGSIVSAIMNVQSQTDKWTKLTSQLGAIINVLKDRIAFLGSAIMNLLDGDFEQAQKDWAAATSNLVDEIKEEVRVTGLLADLQAQLIRDSNDFLLTQAKRKKSIQELIFLTRDEAVSFEQRMEALLKANALEKANLADNIELQKRRIQQILQIEKISDLETKLADIRANGLRLDDVGMALSSEEERKAAIEAIVQLEELETASLTRQRELRNRINELTNKQLATEKKLQAEFDKENDIEVKANLNSIDFASQIDEEIKLAKKASSEKIKANIAVFKHKEANWLKEKKLKEDQLAMEFAIAESLGHNIALQIENAGSISEAAAAVGNSIKQMVAQQLSLTIANAVRGAFTANPILGLILAPIAAASAKALFNGLIPSFFFGGDTGDRGIGFGDKHGEYTGFTHKKEFVISEAHRQDPYVANTERYIESQRLLGSRGPISRSDSGRLKTELTNTDDLVKAGKMMIAAASEMAKPKPAYFTRKSFREASEDQDEKNLNKSKGSLKG